MRLRFVLEILSGPKRGATFELSRKETIFGRGGDCHLCLEDDEVSRRHCSILVSRGEVVLKDLGSANGTLVNGRLVEQVNLNSGDVVRVGKSELRLSSQEADTSSSDKTQMHAVGKVDAVTHRLRGLGWSSKIMLIMLVAALISHALVAWPLISEQRKMASQEALRKAGALVTALAALSQEALRIGDEMLLDVERISQHEGVVEAYVYDRAGRILAPVSRFLQTPADPASRRAIQAEERTMVEVQDGVYDLSEPIRIYDVQSGRFVKIGTARIIFSLHSITSLEEGVKRNALISLIVLLLVAAAVASAIGYVTSRPVNVLRDDLEAALKGDGTNVSEKLGLGSLNRLAGSINRALIKISTLAKEPSASTPRSASERTRPSGDASSFGPLADQLPNIVADAVMAADADNIVLMVNSGFCELMGVNPDVRGKHFFEAFPDQAVLSGVMKLIHDAVGAPEKAASATIEPSSSEPVRGSVMVEMLQGEETFRRVVVVLSRSIKEQKA